MNLARPEPVDLIEDALQWTERLRTGEDVSGVFLEWLTQSPRHVEVFMQAMMLERRIAGVGRQDWEALLRDDPGAADNEPDNVIALARTSAIARPRSMRRRWLAAGAAATVLAATGGAFLALSPGGQSQVFATTVGEQRVLQLGDGSLVHLNTGSRLEARLSDEVRELRLTEGEALFKVRPDARPFRVRTPDAVIEALGTEFNVHRREGETTVAVLEGRVRVDGDKQTGAAAQILSPGDAVRVDGGHVGQKGPFNRPQVISWQQRRLVFDEETLANIVLEFNRYNRHVFRIEDPAVAGRRFSGVFDADDPDSLAQLLGRDGGLEVERGQAGIVIRAR